MMFNLKTLDKLPNDTKEFILKYGIKINNNFIKIDPKFYKDILMKNNPPGTIQKVSSLSKSMVTWAGSGFKKVQQHVYEKRLAICRKCQFWQENGNMGMGKCLKCGCGKGKHWLPHEQCPIGLWGKEQ
jgi:hypothetical protein